jgi:hypothetical protein
MGDAGPAGDFAHAQVPRADRLDLGHGGRDDRVTQLAVMVGTSGIGAGHGASLAAI